MEAEQLFLNRIREFNLQLGALQRKLKLVPTEFMDDLRTRIEALTVDVHQLNKDLGIETLSPQWRS